VSKILPQSIAGGPPGTEGTQAGEPAFLADAMLGRLARALRLLGFDTAYVRSMPPGGRRSLLDRWAGRILLTRNVRWWREAAPKTCLLITDDRWEEQVRQVLHDLALRVCRERCFTRCLLCNAVLETVAPETAWRHVPEYVASVHGRFRRCPSCGRVYWRGTHRSRMTRWVERVLATPG